MMNQSKATGTGAPVYGQCIFTEMSVLKRHCPEDFFSAILPNLMLNMVSQLRDISTDP